MMGLSMLRTFGRIQNRFNSIDQTESVFFFLSQNILKDRIARYGLSMYIPLVICTRCAENGHHLARITKSIASNITKYL